MFRPNREFQAGLNQKEARRQREANSLRLRRKDRELKLQNKRKKILNKNNTNPNHTNSPSSISSISLTNSESIKKSLQNLGKYVNGCYKDHPATILECSKMIRELTAFNHEDLTLQNIKKVIDSGVIPRIIQLLAFNKYPNIQFEALWILTNIASTTSINTNIIVEKGAIQSCYQIIKMQKYPLQEQAIWALGNISGENTNFRDMVIKTGILQLLIQICKTPFNANYFWKHKNALSSGEQQYVQLFHTLSWMLSNACRGKFEKEKYKLLVLECIYHLIKIKNQITIEQRSEIEQNISWALQYLTASEDFSYKNKILRTMNECGITEELINLMGGPPMISRPAVKTIGNILTGDDSYAQICLNFGILKQFHNLFINGMQRNDTVALKELCWCMSNITACDNIEFTKCVINANIFPMVCQLLTSTASYLVSKEALWAVANAMSISCSNREIMNYLCDENKCDFIKYLCYFNKKIFDMHKDYTNDIVLGISLECIEHILECDRDLMNKQYAKLFEEYGGLDFLEEMQSVNISDDTYTKIVNILKTYFGGNDEINNFENGNNKIDDISFNNDRRFSNHFGFGLNTNNSNGNDKFNF